MPHEFVVGCLFPQIYKNNWLSRLFWLFMAIFILSALDIMYVAFFVLVIAVYKICRFNSGLVCDSGKNTKMFSYSEPCDLCIVIAYAESIASDANKCSR